MEFMPVKVNKAIRSEKKHFFFDFKYLKSRSLPVKHAKKYRSPIAGKKKIPTFASQSKIKEIAKRGVAQSG